MTAKNRRERIHGRFVSAVADAIGRFQDVCASLMGPVDLWGEHNLDGFQCRAWDWRLECFGPLRPGRKRLLPQRFLEEALELSQALDMTKEEALAIVGYVFGREKGEPAQEVGGVMVTLANTCTAHGIDLHDAAEIELDRCWQKSEAIKAKNDCKPDFAETAPPPVEPIGLTRENAFALYSAAARASTSFFNHFYRNQGDITTATRRQADLSTIVAELRQEFAADIAAAADVVPMPEASEDRSWFWRIVDQHGFAELPSDEESALTMIFGAYKDKEDASRRLEVERWLASRLYEAAYSVAMSQRAAENGTGFKSRVEKGIKRELEPALEAYYSHHKPAALPAAA